MHGAERIAANAIQYHRTPRFFSDVTLADLGTPLRSWVGWYPATILIHISPLGLPFVVLTAPNATKTKPVRSCRPHGFSYLSFGSRIHFFEQKGNTKR